MPRIDRNARARMMFYAEALDRRTKLPGQHGGVLKRTGLAVLRALLFSFANVISPPAATRPLTPSPARRRCPARRSRWRSAGWRRPGC